MILRYLVPDGWGNHATLTIQATTRAEADAIAAAELAKMNAARGDDRLDLRNAERVDDVSADAVIDRAYFDHELGEYR